MAEQLAHKPTAGEQHIYRTWRNDFPALLKKVNGHDLVFLDSAASSQKPEAVINAMTGLLQGHYANIHRGLYYNSHQTTTDFEAARRTVAEFINAPSENEVIFTRNSTEAINLVAQCWGRKFLKKGDEIILTEMEHHANIVPWQILQEQIGIKIKYVPIYDDGSLNIEKFKAMLSPQTRLVSVVHVSNSLGTINDVKEICSIAKDFHRGIKVVVDGSQAAVHMSVNVQSIGCDFYTFTGHKLYGPTGIGVLWGDFETLETMPPYQGGGDMIDIVTYEESIFKGPPARFEAGTPAFIEAIGLAAAIDYVNNIGLDKIYKREQQLLAYAMDQLENIEGLTFHGTAEHKAGIISMSTDWGHSSDVAMILDQCGVAVRSGHHCCMPLMDILGVDATIRASFGLYTNEADIDALVYAMNKAKDMLGS